MSPQRKRVVALESSGHKGNTHAVLQRLGEALAPHEIDIEIVSLRDYTVEDCRACLKCLEQGGGCIIEDDAAALMDKLEAADGVILSSPVYVGAVSGRLKTLIDRHFVSVHRPNLVGKPFMSVASTAGGYLGAVNKYMKQVGVMWGMHYTGSLGRRFGQYENAVSDKAVAYFVRDLQRDRSEYSPSLYEVGYFYIQRGMGLNFVPLDREYWLARGWDQGVYYYPCRLGWKRPVAWLLDKAMPIMFGLMGGDDKEET